MFDTLKQLLEPVAPSGCESAVADIIETLAAPYGTVTRDVLGNVLVHKAGTGKKILCAAHMDSTGFIVNYVGADGRACITALGSLQAADVLAQRVRFTDGATGIICAKAGTEMKDLTMDKLYVDTPGQRVRTGDVAVFSADMEQAGSLVIAPYLGDRLGCAILLETLRKCRSSSNDLYFSFTVQEEVGARGAGPAAFAVAPDLGIVVDVDTADNIPGSGLQPLETGKGPVLKYMDASTISDPAACRMIEETAAALGIPLQLRVSSCGTTDAGVIQTSYGGAPVTQLAIAVRHMHTPGEVADLDDAAQCVQLLAAVLGS